MFFLNNFFKTFQEPLEPLLGPFFERFWEGLGVENDANKDLTKNAKIVFSLQRESKNYTSVDPKSDFRLSFSVFNMRL